MILCVQGPRAHLTDTPDPTVRFPVVTFSSPRRIHSAINSWDPSKDLKVISENFSYLDASGWYWGAISASEAHSVLQEAPNGTFLIRDSSHPLYMLTLSVKTSRGPTNVRIEYSHGHFHLDSSSPVRSRLQSFPDVPSLLQHYVGSRSKEEGEKTEESDHITSIKPKECAMLLKLKRPIHHPQAFPSLQHLTRLVINKNTTCTEHLPLPRLILQYLKDYPFQL
ncbi:cytokine-inducible SH2-containing protein [Rhinichthys klamathensis goyatoka]|uniref:cytokine-inducible SH2-containing protein n=1 Tax=Rhinichthys klamathensis goyatoka TaxID=3034132 RepID=UPI0024B4D65A|nr:cytokine-inducible SH2-containing protein [Rhinichthys klamathensis goyatoka]